MFKKLIFALVTFFLLLQSTFAYEYKSLIASTITLIIMKEETSTPTTTSTIQEKLNKQNVKEKTPTIQSMNNTINTYSVRRGFRLFRR